jgi:uncharacterized integral membrane protein
MKPDRLSELFPEGLEEIVREVGTNEKLTIKVSEKEGVIIKRETIQHDDENAKPEPPPWEKIAVFAFGVLFLLLLLVIAFLVPNPTDFQLFVFRVALALVAAAVAALVPGFLHVQSQVFRNTIRAGGAIAVFVIVYMVNPPRFISPLQAKKADGPEGPSSTWTDSRTGLKWADRDNGQNVNWNDANAFCSTLNLAKSKWRLPSIEELEGIYDKSVTRSYTYRGEQFNTFRDGYTYYNHVREGTEVNSCCAWSSTEDGPANALYLRLWNGERFSFPVQQSGAVRALCVGKP